MEDCYPFRDSRQYSEQESRTSRIIGLLYRCTVVTVMSRSWRRLRLGMGMGNPMGFGSWVSWVWVWVLILAHHGHHVPIPRVCRYVRVNYSRGQSNFYCFKTFFLSFFSLCHTVTQPKMALVSRASIFASHHQPALVSLPLPSLSTTM